MPIDHHRTTTSTWKRLDLPALHDILWFVGWPGLYWLAKLNQACGKLSLSGGKTLFYSLQYKEQRVKKKKKGRKNKSFVNAIMEL